VVVAQGCHKLHDIATFIALSFNVILNICPSVSNPRSRVEKPISGVFYSLTLMALGLVVRKRDPLRT
jgi:hypothetical protein